MKLPTIDITQIQHAIYSTNRPLGISFCFEECQLSDVFNIRLEAVASEYYELISIVKVNCKSVEQVLEGYGVKTIPTLIFYRNGLEIIRLEGLCQSYEIELYVRLVTQF